MGKRRDPTTKRSKKFGSIGKDTLQEQFKVLEQAWDNLKNRTSNQQQRTLGCCSTDSKAISHSLGLLQNSPREIMSSLQQQQRGSKSPFDGLNWKVKSNNVAVEEIVRERRAAIESGKLKGKRLFGWLDGENEMGFDDIDEICSDCMEREVRSLTSYEEYDESGSKEELFPPVSYPCYSYSGSSLSDDQIVDREKKVAAAEREKEVVVVDREEKGCNVGCVGGNGGKWMLAMGWLGVFLMVFTLGIISLSCNGAFGDEDEVFLVPT